MARELDPATKAKTDAPSLGWAYFVRLDIKDDPLIAWTGWGDLAMAGTGDAAMDGLTFQGITHLVGEISTVTDQEGGSQALILSLPGVDLLDEAMRQVVYDRRQYQFRQAWIWGAFLDEDGNVVGKPFRLKSGRMDTMEVVEEEDGTGTIRCQIESAQAYASEAINTRWSEQKDLDPTDTSQDYAWSLANMTPAFGQPMNLSAAATGLGAGKPLTVYAVERFF